MSSWTRRSNSVIMTQVQFGNSEKVNSFCDQVRLFKGLKIRNLFHIILSSRKLALHFEECSVVITEPTVILFSDESLCKIRKSVKWKCFYLFQVECVDSQNLKVGNQTCNLTMLRVQSRLGLVEFAQDMFGNLESKQSDSRQNKSLLTDLPWHVFPDLVFVQVDFWKHHWSEIKMEWIVNPGAAHKLNLTG